MKVILFGATGMVGQGVLRECLLDPEVGEVLAVGRTPTGQAHAKLREIVHSDLGQLSPIEQDLSGYDACFFCLGISSLGMSEDAYHRVTYDLTMAAATALARRDPAMTFIYVSGTGTDSSERGRTMWARVKGKTENALLALPFRAKYMFRPGFIQPLHGIKSRTRWVRVLYAIAGGLYPLLRRLFPGTITNTEEIGRAMIRAARSGAPRTVLENADISALARPVALPAP
ncbi:MAG: NAD(P)H-binding protein [Bacteroidota bacterium]